MVAADADGQREIDGTQKYREGGCGGAVAAAWVRETCDDDDGPNFGRAFYSVRNDLEAVSRLELLP